MRTLKTPLIFAFALIVAALFVSWTLFDDSGAKSGTSSFLLNRGDPGDWTMDGFFTGDEPSAQAGQPAFAEDVLVQKIPGDNDHLLIMAYYSKENYSGPSFTIENGSTIALQDDGKGDDQVAGDGFYTAKITADVKAFRDQAKSMGKQMKDKGYKPVHYQNRHKMIDADAAESFDLSKFDAHQPVSVSGMTLALPGFGDDAVSKKEKKDKDKDKSASLTGNGTIVAASLQAAAAAATTPTTLLDSVKQNSLIMTDLGVVEDSTRTWNFCTQKGKVNGAWTFGTLMRQAASRRPTQIASDSALSAFVKNWLNNWATTQIINGDTVPARTMVNNLILTPWLTKSRNAGAPAGQLDMRFAPFKLCAIVNRFDLKNASSFSGVFAGAFGETRFVFCLVNSDCSGPAQMTVIFEYRLHVPGTTDATACSVKHSWAQQWINLKNFRLGSAPYNQALQRITDQVTPCGTNTGRPNQSSLMQIRTNEIALVLPTTISPKQWEFREFNIDNVTGNLKETTVGQTPADRFAGHVVNADVQRFVSWINTNQTKILAIKDTVPQTLQGVPFLAGASRVIGPAIGAAPTAFHWDGTGSGNTSTFIQDDRTRYFFSLGTCSGCHAGETQTAFTVINPAFFGKEAGLAGFLTGVKGTGGAIDFDHDSANLLMSVQDAALRPSTNPTIRSFNDIDRRARDMLSYVSTTCGTVLAISSQLLLEPTTTTH